MGNYAKVTDVQSRLPYRTIDQESAPSLADVQNWIDEAEQQLNAIMLAAGLPAPYTTDPARIILRAWVADYCEGRLKSAWAASGGEESDSGETLLEKFNDRLEDIANRSPKYAALFGVPEGSASTVKLRSNVTDTSGEVTNRDPVFTMGDDL